MPRGPSLEYLDRADCREKGVSSTSGQASCRESRVSSTSRGPEDRPWQLEQVLRPAGRPRGNLSSFCDRRREPGGVPTGLLPRRGAGARRKSCSSCQKGPLAVAKAVQVARSYPRRSQNLLKLPPVGRRCRPGPHTSTFLEARGCGRHLSRGLGEGTAKEAQVGGPRLSEAVF